MHETEACEKFHRSPLFYIPWLISQNNEEAGKRTVSGWALAEVYLSVDPKMGRTQLGTGDQVGGSVSLPLFLGEHGQAYAKTDKEATDHCFSHSAKGGVPLQARGYLRREYGEEYIDKRAVHVKDPAEKQ